MSSRVNGIRNKRHEIISAKLSWRSAERARDFYKNGNDILKCEINININAINICVHCWIKSNKCYENGNN